VPESVTNTQLVAEMCDLAIPFPKGRALSEISAAARGEDRPRAGYLKELCITGLKARYGVDYAKPEKFAKDQELAKTLVERLDYEISHHREDRLHRLLPRRLGFHRLGP
jgi:DNA polymerase-3 subunit alpha